LAAWSGSIAAILRVASQHSIIRVRVADDKLSASLPKDSFEAAYGLAAPDANKLGLTAPVCRAHIAPEQRIELVQPYVALDELSLSIEVMTFASLGPVKHVFVESVHRSILTTLLSIRFASWPIER